jgi:outer membrane protein TolC
MMKAGKLSYLFGVLLSLFLALDPGPASGVPAPGAGTELSAAAASAAVGTGPGAGTSTTSSSSDTLYLSLDEAVRLALARNEDVKVAEAEFEKARGRKTEAYAGALPNVSLQAGYTRNVLRPVIFFPNPETDETMKIEIGEKNDFLMAVAFSQPLYAFGRIGGAIKIADYFMRSSEKDLNAARRKIELQAKQAYYSVLLAREALDISARTLEQAKRHLEETRLMLGQQMASRFDSLRAVVRVKNTEPMVIASKNAFTLAELDLKRIVGIESARPVKLTDRLAFAPESLSLDDAIEEALANRPDMASLRLRVAMAQKVYKVRKRSNFPFLSLVGNFIVEGQESERFFPRSERVAKSFGVGLSLSFPVFDGFANRGRVKQAKADYDIARYSFDKMKKAVALQVTQLYKQLQADTESLESQRATVAMAEETYRLALVRFRNGLSTSLELSDAELALTNARLNYLQALYDCIVTKERLKNAMGY